MALISPHDVLELENHIDIKASLLSKASTYINTEPQGVCIATSVSV